MGMRVILFVLLLGLGLPAWGQNPDLIHTPDFEEAAWQGLDDVYRGRFANAEARFQALAREHSNQPGPAFLLAVNLWWQIQFDPSSTRLDNRFNEQLEHTLALTEAMLELYPEHKTLEFIEFLVYGFQARMLALRGEYGAASRKALKCLPAIKTGKKEEGLQWEYLFGTGLYNYYVVWYAEQKPIIKPFLVFFPSGDKALGLQQLETSTQNRNYTQVESAVFLQEIYLYSERKPSQALAYSRRLEQLGYSANPYFQMMQALALLEAKQYSLADRQLNAWRTTYEAALAKNSGRAVRVHHNIYTTFMAARIYNALAGSAQGQNQYNDALNWLNKAEASLELAGEANSPLYAELAFRRGQSHEALGHKAAAQEAYQNVLNLQENDAYKSAARDRLRALGR